MQTIIHLYKMTLKVLRERGLKALFQRVTIFVSELGEGIAFYFRSDLYTGKRLDILYISGCPGGSRQYRCYNQAQELRQYGLSSFVISQNNPSLRFILPHFRAYVMQRVIFDKRIKSAMARIKKHQRPVFFETDDLVFDPSFIPHIHYFNYFSPTEKQWYENGIGRELLEDLYVRYAIVSTHYLGEVLHKKYPDKQVIVSTNKLSQEQVRWAEEAFARKEQLRRNDGKVRIGYFSGTKSHDKDFSSILPILGRILNEYPQVVIMAVGHLRIEDSFLQKYKDRIEIHPFVSLQKLPELILLADINIVPLEMDNPFCQAKSGLKYFDAGMLEVPTIAAATDPFKRIIQEGKTGYLAGTDEEWYSKLSILVADKQLREQVGTAARMDSLEHYTTQKSHEDTANLAALIREEINKSDKNKNPL